MKRMSKPSWVFSKVSKTLENLGEMSKFIGKRSIFKLLFKKHDSWFIDFLQELITGLDFAQSEGIDLMYFITCCSLRKAIFFGCKIVLWYNIFHTTYGSFYFQVHISLMPLNILHARTWNVTILSIYKLT